ncbi:MAG: 23S rRNA (guanosine(2251)-2'-O)-methyltransferase RlmB [Acidimicrobiales bacterium]
MNKPKRGKGSPPQRGGSKGPAKRGRGPARGARTRGRTDDAPGRGPSKSSAKTKGVGGEQVEGRQAVRELLLAGKRKVRELTVSGDDEGLQDLVDLALELRVTVNEVSDNALARIARTSAPQGVVARAAPLEPVELLDLISDDSHGGNAGRPPFLVALDGVTDPGNLGAVIRSAECAGATGLVLPRHRAVNVTPAAAKAAAGAIEHVPIALVGGLPAAMQKLSEHGVWSVGLDAAGAQSLFDLELATEGVMVVLGAEGHGLARLVRQRCDTVVSIPLAGALDSLNVSAAAALACFEVARRRR